MKTTLRNIAITIGLTAVLGTATLFAQNESKANIPFNFQIIGATVPAGQYLVRLSEQNRMLVFRNVETGRSTVVLAHAYKSGTVEDPKLTFRHSGDTYTLESAWFAGIAGGYGPPQRKRDRSENERGVLATVRLLQK